MTKRGRKSSTNTNIVELEYPLFPVLSDWRPPSISDLPSWESAKRIGIDIESRDEQLRVLGPGVRRDGKVIGVSFAIEDGPSFYLPMFHFGGDNVEDPAQALRYLHDNAKHFGGIIVGANIPYDLDYLAENKINFPIANWVRDVQVADPLIYELHQSYALEAIAQRWGLPGKSEDLLNEAARAHKCDPKGQMWKLPARYIGEYAEQDARLPLQILRRQERRIEELGLQKVYDLESKLTPVLLKMRRRGIRIDMDKLERIERWSIAEEQKALDTIHQYTKRRLGLGDVWKAAALSPILTEIGVKFTKKTEEGDDSLDKEVLGAINHPVASCTLRARKVNKLRTTFAASVRRFQTNGRIHATINQLRGQKNFEADGTKGAAFGRCSCDSPNLQQQPSHDEFAKEWRSIYLPEEGMLWAGADYSQQEPRMAIHFAIAAGPQLLKSQEAYDAAIEMARRYREDPATDFHNMVVGLTGGLVTRTQSKPIGLGKMYGMGGAKMCLSLGLPTSKAVWDGDESVVVYADEDPVKFAAITAPSRQFSSIPNRSWVCAGAEGREIIARFDAAVPYVGKLAAACQDRAKLKGEIRTLYKRVCHFPEKPPQRRKGNNDKYDWIHTALNRVIQGSCGDQTKQSLVNLDEEGYFLQMQIHDEVTSSVETKEQAHRMGEVMENSVALNLPFRCEVKIGPTWGDAR